MSVRTAHAEWNGNLAEGSGTLRTESGAVSAPYDFPSRFATGDMTNPEELLGAAHAGCFAMAFANILSQAGHTPSSVAVTARVTLEKTDDGPTVTSVALDCEASVDRIDDESFQAHAETARSACPISRALAVREIRLDARLV